MKEKGTCDNCILPKMGLNTNTTYYNHHPSNSSELKLLNFTLFKDLGNSIYQHILYTHNLPNNDPKKFSLSLPKHLISSYNCVCKV